MKLQTLLPAALLLLLTGCASLSGKPAHEQVEQRATEQMNAFLEKDYPKAFTYMTPGYQDGRQLHGFGADFAGLVDLVAFDITNADCREDRCELTVKRTQKMPGYIPSSVDNESFTFNVVTKQVWVRVKNKWYHYKRS